MKWEEIFEFIKAQKFAKWMTENKPKILLGAQRTPSRINTKKPHLGISYLNCWIPKKKRGDFEKRKQHTLLLEE